MSGSRLLVTGGVAVLVAGAGATAPALAAVQGSHVVRAVSPVHFGVAPTRFVMTGSAVPSSRRIEITNAGRAPLTLTAQVGQFRQRADGGMTTYPPPPGSGAGWLHIVPSSLTLAPGATRYATVTVKVPRAHAGGQRYLSIVWRETPRGIGSKEGAVVSVGLASELILNVQGRVIRHTRLSLTAPRLSFGGAVPISLAIDNTRSNVYTLQNGLRGTYGVTFPGALVLGGSRRVETVSAALPSLCLPCKVTMRNTSAGVWRIPALQVVGGVLVVLAAIGVLLLWRRSIRRAEQRGGEQRTGQNLRA